jgi:hypothetical protein
MPIDASTKPERSATASLGAQHRVIRVPQHLQIPAERVARRQRAAVLRERLRFACRPRLRRPLGEAVGREVGDARRQRDARRYRRHREQEWGCL